MEIYHTSINSQPSFILVLLDGIEEQLLVIWVVHLLIDPELVAGHVVRHNW
jgi:hypothetical protein